MGRQRGEQAQMHSWLFPQGGAGAGAGRGKGAGRGCSESAETQLRLLGGRR